MSIKNSINYDERRFEKAFEKELLDCREVFFL